jgi:uncharacterized protein
MQMNMNAPDPKFLDLLACPSCHGALAPGDAALDCTGCGRSYAVSDRVPVFLDDYVAEREPSLLARLQYAILGNPRVYEFQQTHFGGKPVADRLRKELRGLRDDVLLDIGAGTGVVADLIPSETRYVWLDHDTNKLRGFRSRTTDGAAVLGDAVRLPFRDRVADWTLMVEVSHHIPDDVLQQCLGEAARVTGHRFLFVDAVRGRRRRSNLMWRLDLGRFPRTEAELLPALEGHFEVERVERFRGVNHDHVLCLCVPRPRAAA